MNWKGDKKLQIVASKVAHFLLRHSFSIHPENLFSQVLWREDVCLIKNAQNSCFITWQHFQLITQRDFITKCFLSNWNIFPSASNSNPQSMSVWTHANVSIPREHDEKCCKSCGNLNLHSRDSKLFSIRTHLLAKLSRSFQLGAKASLEFCWLEFLAK